MTLEESNKLMSSDPELFKTKVQETLIRHANAINKHTKKAPIFLIMVMHFYWRLRAGTSVMDNEGINFKTLRTFKI